MEAVTRDGCLFKEQRTYNSELNPDSRHYQLNSPSSFTIPLRRNHYNVDQDISVQKMFEQALDFENFQNSLNAHSEDSKFYDTYVELATMQEAWRSNKKLPGLPTPPTSPDHKIRTFQYNFDMQHPQGIQQTAGLQEVPDLFHDEQQQQQQQQQQHQSQQHEYFMWLQQQQQRTDGAKFMNHGNSFQKGTFTQPDMTQSYVNLNSFETSYQQNSNNNLKRPNIYSNNYMNNNNNIYHMNPAFRNEPNMLSPAPSGVGSPVSTVGSPANRNFFCKDMVKPTEEIYYRQLAYEKLRTENQPESSTSPELSRATHNVLERQRRNDLKLRYNILRDNILSIKGNDKTPKIQILKKAISYIKELKAEEQKLMVDLELERQKRIILLKKLNHVKFH